MIKAKTTVYVDAPTVQEIEDFRDDQRVGEAKSDVGGVSGEGGPDGRAVSVMNVTKGRIDGSGGISGVGADSESGDVKDMGLEVVGGGDKSDVGQGCLERENRRENREVSEEVRVGGVF